MDEKDLSIEQAFSLLDEIISEMEESDISLDNSFQKYKEGMQILKLCNEKIDSVEKKVMLINDNGELDEF